MCCSFRVRIGEVWCSSTMSRMSSRLNSIQQRSDNSTISSLFCGLRQLKNGFSEELQKMRARFGLLRFGKEYNEPCMCHTNAMMQAEIQKAECEICTDSLTAKAIYSCISCHNVLCVLCLRRVRSCPFCRKTGIFAQRNYALERFLTTLNLPCRNQRYGCKELVDRSTRDFHEKNCDYAPVNCPYFYECNWSGEQEALRIHLQEFHSISLINNNHSQVKIKSLWSKIKTTTNKKKTYTMILYCYNSIFLCKISLFKNTLNFSFSQVKSNYYSQIEKDNHFGAAVEVSSSLRNVKGVIPLPKPDDVQEIELSPQFILSQEDLGNDEIEISINIKCLDDML